MKKNRVIIIVVIILAAVAAVLLMQNRKGTLKYEMGEFAIADTASVTKIFMADMRGNQVLLTKAKPGHWLLNDNVKAGNESVDLLLKTMANIAVKAPVPKKSYNSVIKRLATNSIKVEIFQNKYRIDLFNSIRLFPHEKLTKVYYVGNPTPDNMGTFMLLEGSEVPFVVYEPGFRGFVSYIQYDDSEKYEKNNMIRKVKTFTEKPDHELAEKFLASGDFLWNAGIFIWSLKSISDAFATYLDEVDDLFKKGVGKYNTPDEKQFSNETYTVCHKISIDYGIMEKAKNVYVYSADFGWSDLGTWGSLYDIRKKDENGNVISGDEVMLYDTENCIVNVPNSKLVVVQGLDDYIICEDSDALLICKKDEEQQIRQFVTDIKVNKGEKFI